MLKTIVFEE